MATVGQRSIIPADKGKSVVVMNTVDYKEKNQQFVERQQHIREVYGQT